MITPTASPQARRPPSYSQSSWPPTRTQATPSATTEPMARSSTAHRAAGLFGLLPNRNSVASAAPMRMAATRVSVP